MILKFADDRNNHTILYSSLPQILKVFKFIFLHQIIYSTNINKNSSLKLF